MQRRWNVDPRPTVSESPYLCFGGNPIRFSDNLGDSLGDPNWFSQFIQWLEKPSLQPWEKGGAMAEVNENFNPLFILNNHADKILYKKDFYGEPVDYRGRGGAIADAGTDVILYLTGEKLFKAVLGPKNSYQVLEQQAAKNKAMTGSVKPTPTPPNPKLTAGQQVLVNKAVSQVSEDIVRSRLNAGLTANQILIEKPRFYIGNGEKYCTPDFAIYNTETKLFDKIVDAKNGGADFTKGQRQFNQMGGRFEGSRSYPKVKAQTVNQTITKETTNVTY